MRDDAIWWEEEVESVHRTLAPGAVARKLVEAMDREADQGRERSSPMMEHVEYLTQRISEANERAERYRAQMAKYGGIGLGAIALLLALLAARW